MGTGCRSRSCQAGDKKKDPWGSSWRWSAWTLGCVHDRGKCRGKEMEMIDQLWWRLTGIAIRSYIQLGTVSRSYTGLTGVRLAMVMPSLTLNFPSSLVTNTYDDTGHMRPHTTSRITDHSLSCWQLCLSPPSLLLLFLLNVIYFSLSSFLYYLPWTTTNKVLYQGLAT